MKVLLTILEIAEILGVNDNTLRNRGYEPAEKKGAKRYYDAVEIVQNEINKRMGGDVDKALKKEQLRQVREQADKLELQNKQTRGELLHIDDVKSVIIPDITSAKKKLRVIGITISQEVAGEGDAKKIAKIITERIDNVLEGLAFDGKELARAASRRLKKSVGATATPDAE